jgi:hypothetical protein
MSLSRVGVCDHEILDAALIEYAFDLNVIHLASPVVNYRTIEHLCRTLANDFAPLFIGFLKSRRKYVERLYRTLVNALSPQCG